MEKLEIPRKNIEVIGESMDNIDLDEVLSSLNSTGFYDEETGEYIDDTEPIENGWELIVGNDYSIKNESIIIEKAYLFAPDYRADPKIAI